MQLHCGAAKEVDDPAEFRQNLTQVTQVRLGGINQDSVLNLMTHAVLDSYELLSVHDIGCGMYDSLL